MMMVEDDKKDILLHFYYTAPDSLSISECCDRGLTNITVIFSIIGDIDPGGRNTDYLDISHSNGATLYKHYISCIISNIYSHHITFFHH